MKNLTILIGLLFGLLSVMCFALILAVSGLDPLSAVYTSAAISVTLSVASYLGFIPSLGSAFVTVCGEINANISYDCDNPIQAGTRDRGIIFNFEDIINPVYAADNYTVVDIVLASGAKGYVIDGQNNSIEPSASLVEQGYTKMWDHEVMMKGFDISPTTKGVINAMKNGRFVVITENYFRGPSGNSAFEVFGLTTGLEITELSRNNNDADTQGAFHFKFYTNKNKEPKSPNTFYLTDYATTKALVDALLV